MAGYGLEELDTAHAGDSRGMSTVLLHMLGNMTDEQ